MPGIGAAKLAIAPYLLWIKIGAAVVAALLLWWGWHTVTGWREDSHALEATEKALETCKAESARYAAREASAWRALREAEGKAKAREAEDRATAERIERDLQTRLAAADARGRDLARRLLDATRAPRPGAGTVPGAAPAAGQPAQPAGEPEDPGGVGEALAAHLSACEADATLLAGWQEWWGALASDWQVPAANSLIPQ